MSSTPPSQPQNTAGKPRDPRLDFFRGLAMFIILVAHTPGNPWTLWIPARFGFSDATEIFVFCSGMASALAFGTVFMKRSWWMGTARILFRVWQVYWAHISVFLATALLCFAIDHYGLGLPDKRYIAEPYVVPFFERTGETALGLLTLSYVPGMFDILPMYLVILALVPLVVALYRAGGRWAVFAFVGLLWLGANLAGYAFHYDVDDSGVDASGLEAAAIGIGRSLSFLNLPANPFGENTWFFNPFAWQLIFFTGFAFGMRWLPSPPVRRWLVALALAYVLLVVPFAWFKIHDGLYMPREWALQRWISDTRAEIEPMWWKTWIGGLRYLHYLALAYLAWVAVGPGGKRLSEGLTPPRPARGWVLALAAVVALLTIPYAYVDEIKALAPALDRWFYENIPLVSGERIGLLAILHLAALVVLAWAALGARGRHWLAHDFVLRGVPVIRKVGTQSLAVFMVSIFLARVNGWLLDVIGRGAWKVAVVNLTGFAILIAVAYLVSWFKSQPWRARRPAAAADEKTSGADGRGQPRIAAMRA